MNCFVQAFQHLRRWGLAVSALLITLQISPRAHAALGDEVTAIAADQARMKASLRVLQRSRFNVHELGLPTGTVLRQYVGEAGKVFAVSWSGGWRPSLRDVMGTHYERFIAETRGKRVARGPSRIVLPGMVVVMAGAQRASYGYAYLTDLAPADFELGDAQKAAP